MRRIFCPLPEPLRASFEKLKTSAAYGRGEAVFHEADPCHSVFVVCTGAVKLVTASSQGKILLLRFARAGELLGIETALAGVPFEYSAIAIEPSVLAIIPRDTFVRFVTAHTETCVRLTVALAEQYRFAQRETKFLAFGETSTARLAHLLIDWSAERGQPAADGVHIPSHITHTELAQSIGSTRETVTRILGMLHHGGVVERKSDEIVIQSADELTRLGTY